LRGPTGGVFTSLDFCKKSPLSLPRRNNIQKRSDLCIGTERFEENLNAIETSQKQQKKLKKALLLCTGGKSWGKSMLEGAEKWGQLKRGEKEKWFSTCLNIKLGQD